MTSFYDHFVAFARSHPTQAVVLSPITFRAIMFEITGDHSWFQFSDPTGTRTLQIAGRDVSLSHSLPANHYQAIPNA